MTLFLQSTGNEDPVHPSLKGTENVHVIELSGAGKPDHLHIRGVGESHDAGKVCSCKGAEMAGEGQYVRLPSGGSFMGFLYGRTLLLWCRLHDSCQSLSLPPAVFIKRLS